MQMADLRFQKEEFRSQESEGQGLGALARLEIADLRFHNIANLRFQNIADLRLQKIADLGFQRIADLRFQRIADLRLQEDEGI